MSNLNQVDFTLDGLLEEFSKERPKNPYADFSLLSNPFPTLGQFYGICVNQESVKEEFARKLRDFHLDSQSQIMTILGSTGAGKTNLLRSLEQALRRKQEQSTGTKAITDLFTVFVEQPQGSYLEIHRQVISQLSAMFFTEFFSAVRQRKVNLSKLPAELPGTNPELIQALIYITQKDWGKLPLPNDSGEIFFPAGSQSHRILGNWLQGVKLTAAEKKELGSVSAEIGKSSTVAIKFLSDLVKIFLHTELFKGLIIFLDEFEEVFSGLSPTSQAQYAQDLRNLFDSHPKGIVFVVATAPIGDRLQQISPALQRRLGAGVQIDPIADEISALEYARAYIQWGRDMFKEKMNNDADLPQDFPDTDQPYHPLNEAEIREIYKGLRASSPEVVPGDLLPALNLLLYQRVYAEK